MSEDGKTPGLSPRERQDVNENQPPRAAVLHEIIRTQGDQELERKAAALWWSALAAGLTMGLSLMAMGLLHARLPDSPSSQVIASLGYSAGFLAVILARQQLFTENTLTAVLPVMSQPTLHNLGRLLRLWGVVLAGNLAGTLLVAWVMLHLPIFDGATDRAFLDIGRKVMENDNGQMFAKGIVSGWMIAGHLDWAAFWIDFAGPTLAGNIVGGSLIFALISHAQVRSDTRRLHDARTAETETPRQRKRG